jgi:molybdopterin molybdotransferase
VTPLVPQPVSLQEARGSVLAEEVTAPHPMPRFDNSAMDGFAVRSADLAATDAGLIPLTLAGEVRAGDPGDVTVEPGTAVRIMTGAPVPPGADAVVPVELAEVEGGIVRLPGGTPAGIHIRRAGEDFAAGALLIEPGRELRAGELALLASIGHTPVTVYGAPKVAIVVTGDELVEPDVEPLPGQIRDSNSLALSALVLEAGGEPLVTRVVGDDLVSTVEALRRAAETADLVVSSGGVAVGRYDFVKEAVDELGQIDMWGVAMQPGKPVVLGRIGDVPFLGLPGNPVSVHISFEQFVRPAIRKMRGCRDVLRSRITARLTEALTKKPGRLHFVRVRLRESGQGWEAVPTGAQGSHIQTSLVDTHGVALFESDLERLEEGAEVTVEVWSLPGREA